MRWPRNPIALMASNWRVSAPTLFTAALATLLSSGHFYTEPPIMFSGSDSVAPERPENQKAHAPVSREESEKLLLRKQEMEERMAEEAQRRALEPHRPPP